MTAAPADKGHKQEHMQYGKGGAVPFRLGSLASGSLVSQLVSRWDQGRQQTVTSA